MSSTNFIITGMVGELSAVLAIISKLSMWSRLLLFVIGHAIASVCFALLLNATLLRRVEANRKGSLALFFSFSFFIPIFGGLGMLAALVYFRFFQRFIGRTEFFSVPLSPFMNESGAVASGMGEGGAWSRLRMADLPRSSRLKALMAVGSGGGQNASRLLQMATCDSDDEIRLLAFNLYDRREKVISEAVSNALSALRKTENPDERRKLCRQLAFSYWEMVFNDLAKNDLAVFFVNQSLAYVRQALEIDPTDATLLILQGRLYLWQGHVQQAEQAISAALQHGAHRDRVIPYLAELAYRRQDFTVLKNFFRDDPLLRYKPGIGPVAQFWMG